MSEPMIEPKPRGRPRENAPALIQTANPRIDRGAPAYVVMSKFGSISNFSRQIQRRTSTCYRWLERGHIPPNSQSDVIAASDRIGAGVTPQDFLDNRLFDR